MSHALYDPNLNLGPSQQQLTASATDKIPSQSIQPQYSQRALTREEVPSHISYSNPVGHSQPIQMTGSKPHSTHAFSASNNPPHSVSNPVNSVNIMASEPEVVPEQDDFYLLDVMGGSNVSVMHPTKPVVAYTTGKCQIFD